MLTERQNAILDKIVKYTCRYFEIEVAELYSSSRKANLVNARCVYARVADEYIDKKVKIAAYVDRDKSMYHSWMKKEINSDIQHGISSVRFAMKGTLETIQIIDDYFELKEEIETFEREIKENEEEIRRQKIVLEEWKEELQEKQKLITIEEIHKLW